MLTAWRRRVVSELRPASLSRWPGRVVRKVISVTVAASRPSRPAAPEGKLTMITEPVVSVIVPTHDAASLLPDALGSVFDQTFGLFELIVVDDGSTDDTSEVLTRCDDPRLRFVRQPRQGAAAARNRGVSLARAPFLAFLDADDLWHADKLETQCGALDVDPGLDMVFGHVEEFDDVTGEVRPPVPGYSSGTLLVRTSAFMQVGLFSVAWRVGEFIDWYARAVDCGLTGTMRPEVVMRRRVHAGNTSRSSRQDYARVMLALHHRRRAAGAL
jgi:glycosyltransferase involved in cell wall biosynthesis